MMRGFWLLALPAVALAAPPVPVDHHQHLLSPQMIAQGQHVIDADEVAKLLDAAGIRRAVLLSAGYIYSQPSRKLPDAYAKVRADNDWTAAQALRHADRFKAFCGINPLADWALEEIERCSRVPVLRDGIKLHFGNADVQLEKPGHAERVRRVFEAANAHRMAIVVHMRASISLERPYGEEQARAFLGLLRATPDVVVQVAHMAGSGPGFEDPPAQAVLAVLAEACERRDPRTRNLWFDVASIVHPSAPQATLELIARRIRQVGIGRVLYGTDAATGNNLRPRESWTAFQRLPLAPEELAIIARNVAPYMAPGRQP